jgi:hypothetical protein
MRLLPVLLVVVLTATSCSRAKIIYEDRSLPLLRSEVAQIRKSEPTHFQGVYYIGSDSLRHYFVIKLQGDVDRRLAVFKNELPISEEKAFYLREFDWVDFTGRL